MKILYIANIRLPTEKAHGIQIMKTCEAFAQSGASVELVVPTRRTHITEDPFSYYGVIHPFPLTTLRVPDWVHFGPIGFLASLIIFSERAHFLKSFWSADIVYSRDAFVLLQYILLGRKIIFEAHAKPTFAARIAARRAYRVVVISKALEAAYQEAGVPSEKIIVAPDAVDPHLFDAIPSRAEVRTRLGIAVNARVVVYTGHLYVRKGVETLAEVAALAPDTQFFFVGGTAVDIATFRARWGSIENIHIIGHVPPMQVPLYLRAADVLILPNSGKDQDAREFTSPMKLFEYMASGTPIVASDVSSVREVLDEQSATFFTPDDPAILATSIMYVLSHESEVQQKARSARQKVTGYNWEGRIKSILAVIKNANQK